MSEHSPIEWTDSTWNPVRGCTKISPGCKHCYAETFAERFRGVPGSAFEQGFDLRLVPEKLYQPLRWRSPRKIFVNSMSDLFHEEVPTEYIAQIGTRDEASQLAHVSGSDEAPRAPTQSAIRRAELFGEANPHLVRCKRRGPRVRLAACRSPPAHTGDGPVPIN